MSPSHFSIATTSRIVRPLSFKETIRCLTYLDIADMMHHTNLHIFVQTIIMYICALLLPKMQNLEAFCFPHLRKASSEEAFRNIERSLPHRRKKPSNLLKKPSDLQLHCKRKYGKTFRRAVSFLKTCTVVNICISTFYTKL